MKKPVNAQALLDHIKAMDHRERITLELSKEKKETFGNHAYQVEIYVTYPFETARCFSTQDEYRVLFQVTDCAGKTSKILPKTSIKRSFLNTKEGNTLTKVFNWTV